MVKAELPTVGLPVKDRGLMLETAEVLKKNISFDWKGPQEWAGLSKKDLVELTVQIAAFIGITPQQAEKISIIFADHHRLPWDDLPDPAACNTILDNGVYSDIIVVLNRSLEVVEEHIKDNLRNGAGERAQLKNHDLFDHESDTHDYDCKLTPFEVIVWEITEELKHAHVTLMAGSESRYLTSSRRYLEMLKAKGSRLGDIYDIELQEVVANRLVLRVLGYLSTEQEGRERFRRCYLESLRTGHVFFPLLAEGVYIQTGYKTPIAWRLKNILRVL